MRLKPPYEVEHDEIDTYVALLGKDYAVAKVFGKDAAERKEGAAFIVRACNSHDELVAALRDMVALAHNMNDASDEGGMLDERHDAAVALLAKLEVK